MGKQINRNLKAPSSQALGALLCPFSIVTSKQACVLGLNVLDDRKA